MLSIEHAHTHPPTHVMSYFLKANSKSSMLQLNLIDVSLTYDKKSLIFRIISLLSTKFEKIYEIYAYAFYTLSTPYTAVFLILASKSTV
jgi:hypothetical protein